MGTRRSTDPVRLKATHVAQVRQIHVEQALALIDQEGLLGAKIDCQIRSPRDG